jgi:meso-butanediol dehydrogenase / (S,S)-butanediol dehydrogenase / diacetyl reductase
MLRFQKVVIATGVASGIAAGTARRFSFDGGCVALVDRNEIALVASRSICRKSLAWCT